jgi:hypothetical protein
MENRTLRAVLGTLLREAIASPVVPGYCSTEASRLSNTLHDVSFGRLGSGRGQQLVGGAGRFSPGDMALFAAMCLFGGVFIFLWGRHPALMIAGIAMFAVVGGWLGYSFRKRVDPQSSTSRRIRTAVGGGLLAGLAAFEVSIVFCSCG